MGTNNKLPTSVTNADTVNNKFNMPRTQSNLFSFWTNVIDYIMQLSDNHVTILSTQILLAFLMTIECRRVTFYK